MKVLYTIVLVILGIIAVILLIRAAINLYRRKHGFSSKAKQEIVAQFLEPHDVERYDEDGNRKVLLKVENLSQYFKMGPKELKAVNNVSFEVYAGEVFGLVGESGCGKTTTGRSIIRLYNITGGSVYFKGTRICAGTRSYIDAINAAKAKYQAISKSNASQEEKNKALDEYNETVAVNKELIRQAKSDHKNCNKNYAAKQVQLVKEKYADQLAEYESLKAELKANKGNEELESKVHAFEEDVLKKYNEEVKFAKKDRIMNKIQMIFQDPIASLDPRMTVRDIIAEGLVIRGIKDEQLIDELVFKILETVGLVPEHASRYPHEFSGGQRQRIGIARAVILNPELIIADEPISALDVSIQAQVINLLNELSEKMGLTTLFIAHDLAVVKYFSNRIAVMYYGNIVELGTSDELFKFPFHPYTRSLLSAIPVPDPYTEKHRTRIQYNPIADHDYREEGPSFREIYPGHFVLCNTAEFNKYRQQYEEGPKE